MVPHQYPAFLITLHQRLIDAERFLHFLRFSEIDRHMIPYRILHPEWDTVDHCPRSRRRHRQMKQFPKLLVCLLARQFTFRSLTGNVPCPDKLSVDALCHVQFRFNLIEQLHRLLPPAFRKTAFKLPHLLIQFIVVRLDIPVIFFPLHAHSLQHLVEIPLIRTPLSLLDARQRFLRADIRAELLLGESFCFPEIPDQLIGDDELSLKTALQECRHHIGFQAHSCRLVQERDRLLISSALFQLRLSAHFPEAGFLELQYLPQGAYRTVLYEGFFALFAYDIRFLHPVLLQIELPQQPRTVRINLYLLLRVRVVVQYVAAKLFQLPGESAGIPELPQTVRDHHDQTDLLIAQTPPCPDSLSPISMQGVCERLFRSMQAGRMILFSEITHHHLQCGLVLSVDRAFPVIVRIISRDQFLQPLMIPRRDAAFDLCPVRYGFIFIAGDRELQLVDRFPQTLKQCLQREIINLQVPALHLGHLGYTYDPVCHTFLSLTHFLTLVKEHDA